MSNAITKNRVIILFSANYRYELSRTNDKLVHTKINQFDRETLAPKSYAPTIEHA